LSQALTPRALKVNLFVSRESGSFHVDKVELYSPRQQAAYLKQVSEELGMEERILKKDLGRGIMIRWWGGGSAKIPSCLMQAVTFGGLVLGAFATLRVFGASLDPDEVTTPLQRAPTSSYRAGDRVSLRVAAQGKRGMWLLESVLPCTEHRRHLLQRRCSRAE
jgi:hypothetical protein